MGNPPFMGMPLFAGRDGEAIELALGIGELNTIAGLEVAATFMRSLRHVEHLR